MTENPPIDLAEFFSRTGNLLIHLLDKCNLQCEHCYLNASKRGKLSLPVELVKRTIDEASSLGMSQVQFSGGEPFMYPGIFEVLAFAHEKIPLITVSTNGTLIDEKTAGFLADIRARVVTSIDGPPRYHNRFRGGKECFSQTQDGITRLMDHGVPTTVVTTINNDNLEYVDWCAEWAHKMCVPSIQFQPLEKVGRGLKIANHQLSNERLNDLFIHLSDLAARYASKNLQIKMTLKSRDHMKAHPCTAFVCNGKRCHRGVDKELKKLVIRENGDILPELVDIDRRFAVGNLYQETLKENIITYLSGDYAHFDALCREVYKDTVLNYPSPLVPWNEILMVRSHSVQDMASDRCLKKTSQTIPVAIS